MSADGTIAGCAIRVEGLQKSFGDYPVLSGLDLTVEWGRLVVIFGANGSGKTTLLKLLSTQYRPDVGEIWIGGIPRSRDPVGIRRLVGVVAHHPMLYEDMTCRENLRFFGRMHGLDGLAQRIDDVLHEIGLEGRQHERIRSLSHGIQKRLSIGRAILHDPPILLMDEPESGLDQKALDNMSSALDLRSGSHRTVVMATHNVNLGLAWAHEVAVLLDGKIAYKAARRDVDEACFKRDYLSLIEVSS